MVLKLKNKFLLASGRRCI